MIAKQKLLAKGIQLEMVSIAWMALEFVLGVSAGLQAGSILLIAFGLDALLEVIAGGVLIWRLRAEYDGADNERVLVVERRASKIVKAILLLLATYVIVTSVINLVQHEVPGESGVGLIVAIASVVLMPVMTTLPMPMACSFAAMPDSSNKSGSDLSEAPDRPENNVPEAPD